MSSSKHYSQIGIITSLALLSNVKLIFDLLAHARLIALATARAIFRTRSFLRWTFISVVMDALLFQQTYTTLASDS